MKWAIYGIIPGDYGYPEDTEEVVATFDSRKNAEKYLRASKLKRPQPYKYPYNTFRMKSLLSYYSDVYVQKYCPPEEPIHEPEINW